jgi:hypothetical protein
MRFTTDGRFDQSEPDTVRPIAKPAPCDLRPALPPPPSNIAPVPSQRFSVDTVAPGDCVQIMRQMPPASVDFILTDPPYLVNYHSRDGRAIQNDADNRWLKPSFVQAYRVLRPNRFCVSFYGWSRADQFIAAWREAGFRLVGHLVFRKSYASSTHFLRYHHEQAYLLAKGSPALPKHPIPDVLEMRYTGNKIHPTQKDVSALLPLMIRSAAPAPRSSPRVLSGGIPSELNSTRCTMRSQSAGWPNRSSTAAHPRAAGKKRESTRPRRIRREAHKS